MAQVRVAFAPADKQAALDVVEALQALGVNAAPAPVRAGRTALDGAPAVLVWSKNAAADARLRALSRSAQAPVLARIDAAPTPRTGAARIDVRQRGWQERWPLTGAAAMAPGGGAKAASGALSAQALAAPDEDAPVKKKSGAGLIVLAAALLAAALGGAAYWAWDMGYLEPYMGYLKPYLG